MKKIKSIGIEITKTAQKKIYGAIAIGPTYTWWDCATPGPTYCGKVCASNSSQASNLCTSNGTCTTLAVGVNSGNECTVA